MNLTTNRAYAVIAAAESKARELGVPIAVAVLDSGTCLKAFSRMDGAPLGSIVPPLSSKRRTKERRKGEPCPRRFSSRGPDPA